MRSNIYFNTDGSGFWSRRRTRVLVRSMSLGDLEYPELRVYFDPRTWNNTNDGLIYTDQQWLIELKNYFRVVEGFSAQAVDEIIYSEQGMQGDDYVSLDVGDEFVREWNLHQNLHPTR